MTLHGDCKVYDKNGELIRVESIKKYYAKKDVLHCDTAFKCTRCGRSLRIDMTCKSCRERINQGR